MILALALLTASPSPPDEAGALIRRLGPSSDIEAVAAVGRYGCRAVPSLVRQLEPVRTRQIGIDQARYVRELRTMWSLATLRYITGRDFYAQQTGRGDPDSPGWQMLHAGAPPGRTKFFGVWMSRGNVYFARPVEQAEIIRQWRRYSASGQCRPGRGNRDMGFWLYGRQR